MMVKILNKFVIITLLLSTSVLVPVSASGQAESAHLDSTPLNSGQLNSAAAQPFSEGIEQYQSGNLTEAVSAFRQAAASDNPETSAAAYYNQGTIQAELAEQAQDPGEKRTLLEESYQSLKRAAELKQLPSGQQRNARQNMEYVREKLSQLPEEPPEGEDSQQGDKQSGDQGDQQSGDQQSSQQSGDQQSSQQSGQGSESSQQGGQGSDSSQQGGQGQSPEDILQQQRELTQRTESGEGSDKDLAEEQKQLQKASEETDLNEAAVNQAKAAEALKQGDRGKALEYQKAAEQALSEAEEDSGENSESEAEDILNQEAENELQRNRLDKMGGITDAERNW